MSLQNCAPLPCLAAPSPAWYNPDKGRDEYLRMIPVVSSNLASVGFENGILYITFHSGGTYWYRGVPKSVYDALMSAPSHGKYFYAMPAGKRRTNAFRPHRGWSRLL